MFVFQDARVCYQISAWRAQNWPTEPLISPSHCFEVLFLLYTLFVCELLDTVSAFWGVGAIGGESSIYPKGGNYSSKMALPFNSRFVTNSCTHWLDDNKNFDTLFIYLISKSVWLLIWTYGGRHKDIYEWVVIVLLVIGRNSEEVE